MKISIAQIKPVTGGIQENIEIHHQWIEVAIAETSDLVVFPELSLTSYEPTRAKELAMKESDLRLAGFQKTSDLHNISIGLGLPTISEHGILISMIIFQPNQIRKTYSKQTLHPDELPHFIAGNQQLILSVKGKRLAPAICYESFLMAHSENAKALGAEIYLASVAKSQSGVEKAFEHYPHIARKLSMPVLMANSIGFCDNFQSAGQSAVWNAKGEPLEKLEENEEGLLTFDTETGEVTRK